MNVNGYLSWQPDSGKVFRKEAKLDAWTGMPHGLITTVRGFNAAGEALDRTGRFLIESLGVTRAFKRPTEGVYPSSRPEELTGTRWISQTLRFL